MSAIQKAKPRVIELKTDPDAYDATARGDKAFEIRFNDRDYQAGDILHLKRTRYTGAQMRQLGKPLEYTGEELSVKVTHVQCGYGISDNWVGLSHTRPGAVYGDNGTDIEKRMEEHADISCPACGGSGHKDDFKALQSLEGEAVDDQVYKLSELMRGLEIPPEAVAGNNPGFFYLIGKHIAEQAKAGAKPQPPAAPDNQRLINNLRESVQIQERKIERLSELLQKASDYKDYLENPEESPVWIWQGDGEDHPDSMVNSLTVVIRADQLRALVDKAKKDAVSDGFVRVPPGVIRDAVSDLKEVQMRLNQCGAYADPQTTVRICLDRTLEAMLATAQQGGDA